MINDILHITIHFGESISFITYHIVNMAEEVFLRSSVKKLFLKISQNSQENTCAEVSFLINLQANSLKLYLKRGSNTGVLL